MRGTTIFAFLASLVVGAGGAQAHTLLDHANPRVGSTISAAPSVLSLWFTQNVEPAFTSVEVLNATGSRVDLGKARVDAADHSLAQVGLKPLPPGTYTVRWRALSTDAHKTQGSFTFEVRP